MRASIMFDIIDFSHPVFLSVLGLLKSNLALMHSQVHLQSALILADLFADSALYRRRSCGRGWAIGDCSMASLVRHKTCFRFTNTVANITHKSRNGISCRGCLSVLSCLDQLLLPFAFEVRNMLVTECSPFSALEGKLFPARGQEMPSLILACPCSEGEAGLRGV